MVDNVWWKITFSGRRPSVEDDLRWKITFSGQGPLVEDNHRWKATFGGRQPLVEDSKSNRRYPPSIELSLSLVCFAAFFAFVGIYGIF